MRRKNQFSEWFRKQTQQPNAYIYLKSVDPQDIKKWQEKTHTNLETLSLQQAAELTQTYFKNQKNINIQKILHPNLNKNQQKEQDLLQKYTNKPCFLNGYPAKIQKTKNNLPIIFNKYTALTTLKSWKYIHKYYPHFAGGKIFQLHDNIQTIEKLIKKENSRKPYPKQQFVLFNLNYRLETLKGIKHPINNMGIHPLMDRDVVLSLKAIETQAKRP